MGIREGMATLARHEGHWEGVYTYIDPDGQIVDQHTSVLACLFPEDDSEYQYTQTNTYTWPDGRTEEHYFPATYDGYGRMLFDTDRMRGITWCLDETTIYLTWIYKAEGVNLRLFELIVLSEDGQNRCRTWQWVRDGKIDMRTIINETRIKEPHS